jgi:hypothetical protein
VASPFTQDVLQVDDNAVLRYKHDGRFGVVFCRRFAKEYSI